MRKTAVDELLPCCDNNELIVTRVVLGDLFAKSNVDHLRGRKQLSHALIQYRALSKRNGNTKRRKSQTDNNQISFKANALRQIGSTIGSTIVPGDLGPVRSPVRSAFYRSATPGFGGGRRGGSLPGQNRAARCPEGYQYGGRFTDNRFTTCGQQLFDIPSVLGATVREIRRAQTSGLPDTVSGRDITGGVAPSSIIQRRAPQIPRVGNENRSILMGRTRDIIRDVGQFNSSSSTRVRRMVRRDGFVLEPVVPNRVLRAIPDNRDMEGASFIMSALSPSDIGGEELGLLSNTGIRSLVYVLPGGSSLTLEKARKLTVGERRKLGRVVNSAQEINNSTNPSARLINVSQEIGDGIQYSEKFVGIKNPNEPVGKTTRWAQELLFSKKRKKPVDVSTSESRETVSFDAKRKLIKDIDRAMAHLSDGGSLSAIHPDILSEVIKRSNAIQKQKMGNNITAVISGQEKYFMYERPGRFQHLGERFASDVQQFLGLSSPDVLFVGKAGDKRKYLRQDVEAAIPGGVFNPNAKLQDIGYEDVARMIVSDFLTDQRSRPSTSIYPIETPDGVRAVLAQNTTSGLTDLSKIEITKRMKLRLNEFYESGLTPAYSEYYQALKAEQRVLLIQFIGQLINRARKFSHSNFQNDMGRYGMSTGEKIHMEIMEKLFTERLDVLRTQKNILSTIIRGA
jgi:hypothetical protein